MDLIVKISRKDSSYNADAFVLLAYALFFGAGTYGIKAIAVGLGLASLQTMASLLIYLGWFLLLGLTLLKNLHILSKVLLWELVYGAIMLLNYWVFPITRPYYGENAMFIRQIVTVYIPAGVVAMYITSYENCFAHMRKIIWGGSLLMLCSLALGYMNVWDYQYWGVHLSPFVLLSFACYMDRRRKSDLALFVLTAALVLLGGRQSLFVVLAGVFLVYYFMNQDRKAKRFLVIWALIMVVIIGALLWDVILGFLADLMKIFNMQSRTLEMLINGELLNIDTRNNIIYYSLQEIREHGSQISGLFSDRYNLHTAGTYSDWIVYPHNIFLEFFLDFGYVGGTAVSLWLILGLARNMLKGTKERKACIGMFMALVMVRLFVSSSFMIEGLFYTMLGMMMGFRRQTEQIQKC